MNWNKTMIGLGVAMVVTLAALTFVFLGEDSTGGARQQSGAAQNNGDATRWTQTGPGGLLTHVDPGKSLQLYREWAKYPPHSRPLHKGNVDLLDPNSARGAATPVVVSHAKGCRQHVRGSRFKPICDTPAVLSNIRCKLSMERRRTVGRQKQHLYVTCTRSLERGREVAPIKIEDVAIIHGKSKRRNPPPTYIGDTGENGDVKANDGTTTIAVQPSGKDWGWLYVNVSLKVGKLKHSLHTGWFVTPHIVANFGRGIRDARVGGHLEVKVPVHVLKEGHYLIEANLQEKGGEQRYVARAMFKGDLKPGRQIVKLVFWGKIFRDKKIDGPYIVRNIRGQRMNLPIRPGQLTAMMRNGGIPKDIKSDQPPYEYMHPAPDHTTRDYKAEFFSDREWDGPMKRQRIQSLKKLASR